jgi:hypothetical protein
MHALVDLTAPEYPVRVFGRQRGSAWLSTTGSNSQPGCLACTLPAADSKKIITSSLDKTLALWSSQVTAGAVEQSRTQSREVAAIVLKSCSLTCCPLCPPAAHRATARS